MAADRAFPPRVLLDTNVVLRHLLGDHADHTPRSTRFMERLARGEFRAIVPETVVFELVFTMERGYRRPKSWVRTVVLGLLDSPDVLFVRRAWLEPAFRLYVEHNLSFADAWHATQVQQEALDMIVSFDRGLDRVPGLTRIEPA